MLNENINKLLLQLSWNNPKEIQEKAVNELVEMEDLDLTLLLLPLEPFGKCCWENAAKVLYRKEYPKVKDIIPQLFEWLQFMNWPGAYIIVELLKTIPKHILMLSIESTVKVAISEEDEDWLLSLNELINEMKINPSEFESNEVVCILSETK
ncbi:DUF5071 domain-containing protein [Mycoplasmatota bacterium]|nr:DUF5071 domain-containing protein [Mycoplasmatota bacterium]